MKTSKFLMMVALVGAVTFTACNNDDEPVTNDKVAVQFSAGIGGNVATGTPETRAAGTTWAAGDDIGIFTVANGTTTPAIDANMQYETTAGNGTFTSIDAANTIYYPGSGTIDFIAYYPYASGTVLGTPIEVNIGTTQTATSQATFDLLYTATTAGYTSASPTTVPLTFDHKLSKLVMNLVAGSGATLSNVSVSIKGTRINNTFNLSTGALGTADAWTAAITPRQITANSSYDAIIMPSSYADGVASVEITAGGEVYTWDCGAITFAPGSEHIYTITLTKGGGVTVTGTINPWTTGTGGNVTAEN